MRINGIWVVGLVVACGGTTDNGASGGSGAQSSGGWTASGGTPASGGTGGVTASGGTAGIDWRAIPTTTPVDLPASGAPVGPNDPGNAYGTPIPDPSGIPGGATCSEGAFGTGDTCVMFSSCNLACGSDAECPTVSTGTTRPTCLSGGCVLPCGGTSICPDGMACVQWQSRYICMWPVVMSTMPGCPGYCSTQNGTCGATVPCCAGLVCAPWEQCETGDCLQPSWPCNNGNPALCCAGTVCQNGYCTVN